MSDGASEVTYGSYLARTIDQKFFPALWAVQAKLYGAKADLSS